MLTRLCIWNDLTLTRHCRTSLSFPIPDFHLCTNRYLQTYRRPHEFFACTHSILFGLATVCDRGEYGQQLCDEASDYIFPLSPDLPKRWETHTSVQPYFVSLQRSQ